ncbi:MAG: basic amino acid ABC transporter substrate-binding protein [Burkholderiales bacterium]
MKKATMIRMITAAVLTLCLILSLGACGQPAASTKESSEASAAASVEPSAAASESASAEASEAPAEKEKLIMVTNAEFPPYEYFENDKIVGIDAEIAQLIADKLGMEIEIQNMNFDSLIAAVQSGKADICLAGMTVREDRKSAVDFSITYATGKQVIIVKEDSPIASPDDLAGKKIGVQQSTTGDFYCSEDYGDDTVVRFNKGADAVLALSQGKVDAVVIDNEPAKVFVSQNPGLKILETEYVLEDYAVAVNKGKPELLEAINKTLEELKQSGELKAIIDKYIKAD